MGLVLDILSWLALSAGGVFYVIGAVGLNRMPDLFSRLHATSVSDTLGVGLLVLGMLLQAGFTLIAFKLVAILLVLWTSGAVAAHALSRAALHDGEKPLLADENGRLAPTDPVSLFPELRARLAAPLVSESPEASQTEVPMGPGGPLDAVDADPGPRTRGGR